MTVANWIALYAAGLGAFLVIDLIWLGAVGKPVYDHFLAEHLAPRPDWIAAIAFYALFVAGLMYFVLQPAIEEASMSLALRHGAVYGFITYMTFELTNKAVLKDWPWGIVPIDIAWGMVLATGVSAASYMVWDRLIA